MNKDTHGESRQQHPHRRQSHAFPEYGPDGRKICAQPTGKQDKIQGGDPYELGRMRIVEGNTPEALGTGQDADQLSGTGSGRFALPAP